MATAMPLKSRTGDAWARAALQDPIALLDDHAHLERKAAQNALTLMGRRPTGDGPAARRVAGRWTAVLARVAKDEIEHLGLVLKLLQARGRVMSRVHANPYAAALRRLVREGDAASALLDRLLVSALIEARSCERFERLAEAAREDDLRRLYRGLLASERGHFGLFLDLAKDVAGPEGLEARWEELRVLEAAILAAQPPGPRMHAGPGPRGGRRV